MKLAIVGSVYNTEIVKCYKSVIDLLIIVHCF